MKTDKLGVTLSNAQIERIKSLTPYQRSKLGFSCHFASRRVQIWSDYAAAVQSEVVFPVYTYAEFLKWASCVDGEENPVDISGLGIFKEGEWLQNECFSLTRMCCKNTLN